MSLKIQGEWRGWVTVLCTVLVAPGNVPFVMAQQAQQAQPAAAEAKPKTADQLDSLVAPIALYPDPLLAQVLAASTYPLEIVQAQRWYKQNSKLQGEELTKAAAKQTWDPSVQALVAFPAALKLLDENVQWTTDLGNAFLDQQSEVMDAVQRMRKKAKDAGKLESGKEQKVEVKTVESKTVIVVQPADPQVIYVPSYNPTVVYGPPVYAYPPMYYPPSTGAVVATAAISFGVGVAMGAMWGGCCHGGYGWGCGWGGNNTVVVNNNFQSRYTNVNANRTNINTGNRTNVSGNNNWQHNASHRGSVPYSNRNTAQKFGGSVRDSSGRTERFDGGGQSRGDSGRGGDRSGDRGGDRGGNRDTSRDAGNNRSGGQDRVGDRSVGSSNSGRESALGGADSRSRTDAASNRGYSSSRQSSSAGSSARSSGGFSGGGGSSRSSGGRFSGGGGGGRWWRRRPPPVNERRPEAMIIKLTQFFVLTGAALLFAQQKETPKTFASAEEARDTLVAAAQEGYDQIRAVFGGGSAQILRTGDEVQDKNILAKFNEFVAEKAELEPTELNPGRVTLLVGKVDWPFPIPLVKNKAGRWYWDIAEGKAEIRRRTIGANELNAMEVCRGYVEAQRQYAEEDRDGNGTGGVRQQDLQLRRQEGRSLLARRRQSGSRELCKSSGGRLLAIQRRTPNHFTGTTTRFFLARDRQPKAARWIT